LTPADRFRERIEAAEDRAREATNADDREAYRSIADGWRALEAQALRDEKRGF
jgi:hypothetical protein